MAHLSSSESARSLSRLTNHSPYFLFPYPLLAWPDSSKYLFKSKDSYTFIVCTEFAQTLYDSCSGITCEWSCRHSSRQELWWKLDTVTTHHFRGASRALAADLARAEPDFTFISVKEISSLSTPSTPDDHLQGALEKGELHTRHSKLSFILPPAPLPPPPPPPLYAFTQPQLPIALHCALPLSPPSPPLCPSPPFSPLSIASGRLHHRQHRPLPPLLHQRHLGHCDQEQRPKGFPVSHCRREGQTCWTGEMV